LEDCFPDKEHCDKLSFHSFAMMQDGFFGCYVKASIMRVLFKKIDYERLS